MTESLGETAALRELAAEYDTHASDNDGSGLQGSVIAAHECRVIRDSLSYRADALDALAAGMPELTLGAGSGEGEWRVVTLFEKDFDALHRYAEVQAAEVARLTAEREAQRTAYAMQGVERDSLSDRVMALEARLAACASDAGMPEREPHSDKCWTAETQGCVCDVDERYETALRRYAEALRARIAELETLVATLIDRIDDWMVPCPDCNGEGSTERGCSRHGGGCDCEQRTASMTCDRCNGDGQIELVPKGLPYEN